MRKFPKRTLSAAALENRPAHYDQDVREGEGEGVVVEGIPEEIVELNEAATEVELVENDREELEAAAEALEALMVIGNGTLGERGMTPQTAAIFNHSFEHHTARLGIKAPTVGLESFGGSQSQLQATRAALESVSSVLEDIWQWILDVIQSARKRMRDYYERVWAAAPRQISQAEKLIEKMGSLTTKKEDSKVKISASIATKLSIAGKFQATGVSDGLAAITPIAENLYNGYTGRVTAWATEVTSKVADIKYGSDAEFTTSIEAVNLDVKAIYNTDSVATDSVGNDKRFSGTEGIAITKSSELLGGKAVFLQLADADAADFGAAIAALEKTRYFIDSFAEKEQKVEGEQEFEPIPIADAVSICQAVANNAKILMKFKRDFEKTDDVKKKALAAQKKAKAGATKAKDLSTENQTLAGKAAKLLGKVPTMIDQPNQAFSSYLLGTGSTALGFAQKVSAAYK